MFLQWICHTKECKTWYIVFNKINGYIEDNNGSKHFSLNSIDKNKHTQEKSEEAMESN